MTFPLTLAITQTILTIFITITHAKKPPTWDTTPPSKKFVYTATIIPLTISLIIGSLIFYKTGTLTHQTILYLTILCALNIHSTYTIRQDYLYKKISATHQRTLYPTGILILVNAWHISDNIYMFLLLTIGFFLGVFIFLLALCSSRFLKIIPGGDIRMFLIVGTYSTIAQTESALIFTLILTAILITGKGLTQFARFGTKQKRAKIPLAPYLMTSATIILSATPLFVIYS